MNYPLTVIKAAWRRIKRPSRRTMCEITILRPITQHFIRNGIQQGHLPYHEDWANVRFK